MRGFLVMIAAVPLLATGGCVRTAWNVATLPVKAVGKGADLMTTSPKERDEKYVRQQRKQAEREEKATAESRVLMHTYRRDEKKTKQHEGGRWGHPSHPPSPAPRK